MDLLRVLAMLMIVFNHLVYYYCPLNFRVQQKN